jgi:hypothetical protein
MTRVGQSCVYNIYTVCDRIFGDLPAKYAVYTAYMVLANPTPDTGDVSNG